MHLLFYDHHAKSIFPICGANHYYHDLYHTFESVAPFSFHSLVEGRGLCVEYVSSEWIVKP